MNEESPWAQRGTTRWTTRCARPTRNTIQSPNGDCVRITLIHWNTCAGDLSSDRSLEHLHAAITHTPKPRKHVPAEISVSLRTVGSNAARTSLVSSSLATARAT
jgi:hypothetical protein